VVEVAQGVQLVVPDLDPGPERLAIGHPPTVGQAS
jgi:hypothetical protein